VVGEVAADEINPRSPPNLNKDHTFFISPSFQRLSLYRFDRLPDKKLAQNTQHIRYRLITTFVRLEISNLEDRGVHLPFQTGHSQTTITFLATD
jgi:hypothetical protein